EEIADISLMQRVVNNSFKREFEVLGEYEKSNLPSTVISSDAFGAYNIFTGELEKYAIRETEISKLITLTEQHKNNQYCWLLSNAFEKFEKFINTTYNLMSNSDKSKRDLRKVLTYFTDNLPYLKKHEKNNKSGIHLKIAILYIEKLRHAIVHSQGKLDDVEIFVSKTIKDSGISNNKKDHEEFIKQYISNNQVVIFETPIGNKSAFPRYHDVYTHLVSYLIGYAGLVNKAVNLHKNV
ncbi:hypothetical protein, partial [Vibrio rarus]